MITSPTYSWLQTQLRTQLTSKYMMTYTQAFQTLNINARIDVSTQFDIPLMTIQQVEEYIKCIGGNKVTGLDGIGIKIPKLALMVISQSLTNSYNASITKAVFLDKFKQAKLTPVYKKDSPHDRNNYNRPISVLPVISKPLERHVASSYLKYLCKNNLLYSKQSTYHPNHSCKTALLNLTHNWLKAIDKSKFVGPVFLDLSKAFDLVSHDILEVVQIPFIQLNSNMHHFWIAI